MPPLLDILALEEKLEPASRLIVQMMRTTFDELRKQIEELQKKVEELQQERNDLKAQVDKYRQMLFGPSSEKMPPIQSEVRRVVEEEELFGNDDASNDMSPEETEDSSTQEKRETRRRKAGRKKSEEARKKNRLAKKKLPVVHQKVLVTPDQLPQGYSFDDFRDIGDGETIRRLEHVKEHLVLVEYSIQRLASKDGDHLITATSPTSVIEGGAYGPGVYAHTVVSKCVDSLPLYRISAIFARSGYRIARSTLCGLFHRAADLLKPIADRLLKIACSDPYLAADETRIPIQQPGACRTGWIWTFVSKDVIAYAFTEQREGRLPEDLLEGTSGFLQVDAAAIYDSSCKDQQRTRAGCLAHGRRYFFEARHERPDEATQILDLIIQIYIVEYQAAEQNILGTDAHLHLRQTVSLDLLNKIKELVDKEHPNNAPKSLMGKATTYFRNQYPTFEVLMTDPKLRLDNNLSENALRIIALGRKVFLFVGHDVAAQHLAILQTIMSTCRIHDVNPYEYVKDVLIRIQHHPMSKLDELLPQNWQPSL